MLGPWHGPLGSTLAPAAPWHQIPRRVMDDDHQYAKTLQPSVSILAPLASLDFARSLSSPVERLVGGSEFLVVCER